MAWSDAARAAALAARRTAGKAKHGGHIWTTAHGTKVAWLKAGRTAESAHILRTIQSMRANRIPKKGG